MIILAPDGYQACGAAFGNVDDAQGGVALQAGVAIQHGNAHAHFHAEEETFHRGSLADDIGHKAALAALLDQQVIAAGGLFPGNSHEGLVAEILYREVFTVGEGMGTADDDGAGLLEQHDALPIGMALQLELHGEQHIVRATLQALPQVAEGVALHLNEELGVFFPQLIDALREEEVHILSLQHADGEAVGLAAADDLSVGNGALDMLGHFPQLAVEILACAGQLNPLTAALEQLKAHFLLHQSDLTGEVGLGDIEGLGGLGKTAPFGDLHKILDPHQIHNITS